MSIFLVFYSIVCIKNSLQTFVSHQENLDLRWVCLAGSMLPLWELCWIRGYINVLSIQSRSSTSSNFAVTGHCSSDCRNDPFSFFFTLHFSGSAWLEYICPINWICYQYKYYLQANVLVLLLRSIICNRMIAESKVKLTHEWGRSVYSLNQSRILSWVLLTHTAEFYETPEIQIPSDIHYLSTE